MFGSFFAAAQSALKITKLQVVQVPPPSGAGSPETEMATLIAQPVGFMAWILTLLGRGKTSTLSITNQRITRVDRSSNTRDSVVLPLSKASTFHYGFKKPPLGLLVFGFLLLAIGVISFQAGGDGSAPVGISLIAFGIISILAFLLIPRSYYMAFCSVGGLAVTMKVRTKETAELDRMCDLAFDAVRVLQQGEPTPAIRSAAGG